MREEVQQGSVVEFSDPAGLGVLVDAGGVRWPFHCVSIADGTRHIDIGEKVTFSLEFRTLRREAVRVEKHPA